MVGGQVVLLERVILDVEQKQRGASPVTRRVFGSWKLPLNTQPQVNIEFAAPNCARGMPRSF